MKKSNPKSEIHLDSFSLTSFMEHGVTRARMLPLIVYIEEHGDLVYLSTEDKSTVYQVPRDSIRILSEAYQTILDNGKRRRYYRIEVDRSAPCLEMHCGSAGQLLENLDKTSAKYLARTLQVKIEFSANGEGLLSYGNKKIACLGKPNLSYPPDLAVQNIEGVQYQGDYKNAYKFQMWISSEFNNAEMPWAVKIWGQKGIFIHEGPDTLADNGGPSQGCIHLRSPNAKDFYDWITGQTRIQISYPWSTQAEPAV